MVTNPSSSKYSISYLIFFLQLAGIGIIVLAVFFRANLIDLDIVKYEYISFFLLPIIFNLVEFSKSNPVYKVVIYILIGMGLYNNLLPIHCIF